MDYLLIAFVVALVLAVFVGSLMFLFAALGDKAPIVLAFCLYGAMRDLTKS